MASCARARPNRFHLIFVMNLYIFDLWFSEEIAQITYFWCYFCIEHLLYRFVAQKNTYWGNLLQLGLIRHFGWVDMICDK